MIRRKESKNIYTLEKIPTNTRAIRSKSLFDKTKHKLYYAYYGNEMNLKIKKQQGLWYKQLSNKNCWLLLESD